MGQRFTRAIALALGGALPTEFRLFVAGWNRTENGTFLFDAEAAQAVMAAYAAWGVDLAIDLEHQMLDGAAGADPTARDARGWCRLELRSDGSLWAVDVRWTPDGAARLSEKRQRYVSPAFEIDPETKRVTKVINVAITAIPATHKTPALVAASVGGSMNGELVAKALDALEKGDAKAALEILKGLIASAASGEAEPDPADPAEPSEPPAEEMAAAAPPADPEEDKPAAVAAAARLLRLSGRGSIVEAVAEVEVWRKSHIELETERQALAKERATLEAAERRKGCADLVKLGGMAPAIVWADDKCTAPKSYLSAMPIADFRAYVKDACAASAGKRAPAAPAAASEGKSFETPHGAVTLSASELAACESAGAKPEVFARNKAALAAQRAGRK